MRIFFLAASLLAVSGADARALPTVWVRTASEIIKTIPSKRAKELQDSARDLRKQIERREGLALAEAEEGADILITIVDRYIEIRESGNINYGGGNSATHYQSRYVLAYRMDVGEFSAEDKFAMVGSLVTWRRIAGGVAKDIEDWAADNRDALLR